MCSSRRISATWAALESAGSDSLSSASGIGSSVRRRGPGHARAHQPEHVDVVELEALGRVHRHHLHADRAVAGHRLLLAQPGLGDRGDRAGELARGGLRRRGAT